MDEAQVEFIANGKGSGNLASLLLNTGFSTGPLRPFIAENGRSYCDVVRNGGVLEAVPIQNTTALLRKDEWRLLDEAVVRAAQPRLRAVGDIRGMGLQYSIPNGMGKTIFEYEQQSDITDASTSMDGLARGQEDRSEYQMAGLPLPIMSKPFSISARQLANSRQGGSPIDTTNASLAGRKVAELGEKFLLGKASTYTYGGYSIYGFTNHPKRNTKTLTAGDAGGWSPAVFVTEVLDMKKKSQDDWFHGPWMLYNSPQWDAKLDNDYTAQGGNSTTKTLRNRVREIDGIQDVKTLDYLTDWDLVLVQTTDDVVRMVIGMEMMTMQWESHGGLQLHYMVMGIMVPQLRYDINDNMGLVHGSV